MTDKPEYISDFEIFGVPEPDIVYSPKDTPAQVEAEKAKVSARKEKYNLEMEEIKNRDKECLVSVGFEYACAIAIWNETGNKTAVINLLRLGLPLPALMREQIADIIEGKVKRKRTIETAKQQRRDQFIRKNYKLIFNANKKAIRNGNTSLLRKGETLASATIWLLADMYNLGEDSIHSIIRRKGKKV